MRFLSLLYALWGTTPAHTLVRKDPMHSLWSEKHPRLALERKASEALVLARDSQLYVEKMFPAGAVLVMEEGVGLVVVHELLDDGVPFEGTVQLAGYDADIAHGA